MELEFGIWNINNRECWGYWAFQHLHDQNLAADCAIIPSETIRNIIQIYFLNNLSIWIQISSLTYLCMLHCTFLQADPCYLVVSSCANTCIPWNISIWQDTVYFLYTILPWLAKITNSICYFSLKRSTDLGGDTCIWAFSTFTLNKSLSLSLIVIEEYRGTCSNRARILNGFAVLVCCCNQNSDRDEEKLIC